MKRGIGRVSGIALLSLSWVGCGAPPVDQSSAATAPEPPPSLETLNKVDRDLVMGSTGDDVRAVHGYLRAYGYFPNDAIAREFPNWRPLVANAPVDASIFDERSAEAVRRLQQNLGLPVTGVIDEATRRLVKTPRCANPDGIPSIDPSSKYSLEPSAASGIGSGVPWPNATYFLDMYSPGQPERFADALNTWMAATNQYFQPGSTPNLKIFWADLGDNTKLGGTGRFAWYEPGELYIKLNYALSSPWYYGTGTTPQGQIDFRSVMLHELGHALGLGHSSITGAVMYPTLDDGQARRDLQVDDKVAISVKRDSFVQIANGLAMDIGVGKQLATVWIIGTNGQIFKWDGADNWIHDSANGDARAISVGVDGIPWVAAPWGIYVRSSGNPLTGTWLQRNGVCALDVGAAPPEDAAGTVLAWMVGCDNNVYKFDGLFWTLDSVFPAHRALRIDVDTAGLPWVVDLDGKVWHRATTNPQSGWYADLPSNGFGDVGVGPCCYAWGATWPAFPSGSLQTFNYQDALSGVGTATAYWQWQVKVNGRPTLLAVTNVAVGPQGEVWYVDNTGKIYRPTR